MMSAPSSNTAPGPGAKFSVKNPQNQQSQHIHHPQAQSAYPESGSSYNKTTPLVNSSSIQENGYTANGFDPTPSHAFKTTGSPRSPNFPHHISSPKSKQNQNNQNNQAPVENRRLAHSRSQSHNSQVSSPSRQIFQPIHHNQDLADSHFNFTNKHSSPSIPPQGAPPTHPNWTSLIPPMPARPKAAYTPDSYRLYSDPPYDQKPPNKNQGQNSSTSSPNLGLQHQQRHSIAISPNSENNDTLDSFSNNTFPSSTHNSSKEQKKLAAPHNTRDLQFNGSLQAPPAPTEQFPPKDRPQQFRKVSVRRKNRKNCKKCGLEITGQFVRALHSAFHVECFCCHECGNQCSSKFFPYDIIDKSDPDNSYKVALCEYDYFKKLDLICFNCNNALRGPYITALGNKYHLEHFKCNVCQKVFESDESYYEHEGNIFCHYHYSKLYASHCEGCHSSIVKQFVELYRGGRNQQWHPECYMVHKFWNVCIMADSVGLQSTYNLSEDSLTNLRSLKSASESEAETEIPHSPNSIDPKLLLSIEQQIENIVMQCWLTLSGYEETTAACISDMLLNACTGNQANGLLATVKLVLNVEVLFVALDHVSKICQTSVSILKERYKSQQIQEGSNPDDSESSVNLEQEYFQQIKKEPRNMSGKIMSYLAILRKSGQISQSGSLSAELLSVITGCAHYLKLLIRIGLNNALKANKLLGSTAATDIFLQSAVKFESFNKVTGEESAEDINLIKKKIAIPVKATDACFECKKSIEKSCARFDDKRWHFKCFSCSVCSRAIPAEEVTQTKFNDLGSVVVCKDCEDSDSVLGYELISDLSQLVYLLHIALSRSQSVMKVELGTTAESETPNLPVRNASTRTTNITRIDEDKAAVTEDNYSQTISDVTRLRTRRQSQKLSNSIKKNARKSVILDAPIADKARQDEVNVNNTSDDIDLSDMKRDIPPTDRKGSAASHLSYIAQHNDNDHFNVKAALKIRDEPQRQLTNAHLDRTSDLLKNEKSLTLDDIPRIVAAEQARDQRPNAFKHHNSLYQRQKPMDSVKNINLGSNNSPSLVTPSNALDNLLNSPSVPPAAAKKATYYSELTKDEHFVMRHIAVEALMNISGHKYVKEEILGLIQTKKSPTFWDKFKFGGGEKRDKNMNVFGVDLQDLTKKYGVDSDLGVGPSKLRIPIVVDDVINALRQKDMSVEGIFRLNGNIKKLRELTEQINKSPLKSPDFSSQTAVQLAALMKKWLRELPNPLLTFNLYELWISSQAEQNLVVRKRILQLVYCMLPRSHRNLVEVLLYFFSWVASFAEIDEETGSKMDIHNLATVIAPNVLFAKQAAGADPTPQSGDTYFLAIEVVNQLIELHEELSVIPDDLLQFFEKCGFSGSKSESLSTKEIMHRLEKESKEDVNYFRNYEKLAGPDVVSNQMVHSNTISRGHSKVFTESHGETSRVD